MKELADLTGNYIKKSDTLYNWLKDNDVRDFHSAMDRLAMSDEKVNLHALLKYLNNARADRQEQENRNRKEQEEREAKAFWKANYRDGNCSRSCQSCPAVYCNHVANETIKELGKILNKQKTWQQACKELADMFPGVGFERQIPELAPF